MVDVVYAMVQRLLNIKVLTSSSTNESFRIKYNVTRGMEMEFYISNEIIDRQESPAQQIVLP
jgi:hypothetical protein